jgi:acetyl-CoA acetyltransferase/uncharacterized OB-fold protein
MITATPGGAPGAQEEVHDMHETIDRPLPARHHWTDDFWTGGADGELRILRCASCRGFVHPPMPACPYCRGDRLAPEAVSGRATVIGCSVNYHQWDPRFPPPFVFATVALDEDARARLMTNLVGCEPGDAHVGMRVQVRFEQHDDVWIPLFVPTGEVAEELPTDDVAPQDAWRTIRPMATTVKYEDAVALTGIGRSRIGRRLMVDPLALTVEACRNAVADAGLRFEDIDGLSTYPGSPAFGGFSEGGVTALEDTLRIRPTWYNGGSETFGPAGSVVAAMIAVAAGLCRHVLCFRTVWQATFAEQQRRAAPADAVPAPRVEGSAQWSAPFGHGSAAQNLAMCASYHFARYGTTRETLGWIAINNRANAARNPIAIYREPFTMDDYLSARMITTPFGLYDCDVPCDASVAVVVSAKEASFDLAKPPILVEAVGTQLTERVAWEQSTLSHEPQVLGPAAHLWTRTSLRPADVDVAQLYDGFSFNCLSWIEGLGFCGIGEAKDFLDGGRAIALDGELPLNTHGGQLSEGRTHGMGLVHEAVVQLRGDGADRQVPGARVAVVSSGGLTPSSAILLRTAT